MFSLLIISPMVVLLGWGTGCVFALLVLLYALARVSAVETTLVLSVIVLALPCTARLALAVVDQALENRSLGCDRVVVPLAGLALLTPSSPLTLFIPLPAEGVVSVSFLAMLCARICGCAALTAGAALLLCALVEVPVRWFGSATRVAEVFPFASLRLLGTVLFFALSFQFLALMYTDMVSPAEIVRFFETGAA